MAADYKVNVSIGAGTSFNQKYYLTEPDLSPLDITESDFYANLAKHSRAKDITSSTDQESDYNYYPFTCYVENGPQGEFSLNMSPEDTAKLEEGKYVYSVTMRDRNGYLYEVVSGLAFVDTSFGLPFPIN
jgi:hypothetical protein